MEFTMSLEIERKFLVLGDEWKKLGQAHAIRQGYLSSQRERVVRVRIEDQKATLTIKGSVTGITRGEWEYEIPFEEADELLNGLCERPLIEKNRTRIVAEIELESENQVFAKPEWVGVEVTDDARYFNANLLRHPFTAW
jgi:adenylate cyclase